MPSSVPPPDPLHVDVSEDGARLDVFVADRLPHLSRSRVRAAIDDGLVRVDDKPATKAGLRVSAGQRVELRAQPTPPPTRAEPEPMALDVVYEDDALLVVNKPAGLVVHPAAGHSSGTLVNGLLHHAASLGGVGDPLRPGLVHRLDKDTSGLMVVAKTEQARASLTDQLQRRTARRLYLAVVLGRRLGDAGTFDTPYGRHPRDRLRFTAQQGQRRAVTHWEVLARGGSTCLVAARLQTGRTHQIRVHFAEVGYPVAGDALYGGRRDSRDRSHPELRAVARLQRHALHAAGLAFLHPRSGAPCAFTAAWPEALRALSEALFGADGAEAADERVAAWVKSAERQEDE